MKRVLFVDDEVRVLDGLRRLLRAQRRHWEMAFAAGGEAALAELARAPFDVIVTDMLMPGMDGAALLQAVQEQYPHTVRIVLSGHMEPETVLRAVPVAHQYLSKPCDPDLLVRTVERVCALQTLLTSAALRATVSKMGSLPSVPRIYGELTRALADPDVPLSAVARIIEQDVAMAAKCLHLVNSAFFGLPQRITSVRHAVSYLGTSTLKGLVLSTEVFWTLKGSHGPTGVRLELVRRHASIVAGLAAQLLPDRRQSDDAFAAALLHDVGKLLLAAELPEWHARAEATAQAAGSPLHVVEEQLFGVTHAEVGAYLLGLWGLPHTLVEAVAHHHAPWRAEPGARQRGVDVAGAVYVANLLVEEIDAQTATLPGACPGTPALDQPPAREYLTSIGVADRLPAWRAAAGRLRESSEL